MEFNGCQLNTAQCDEVGQTQNLIDKKTNNKELVEYVTRSKSDIIKPLF